MRGNCLLSKPSRCAWVCVYVFFETQHILTVFQFRFGYYEFVFVVNHFINLLLFGSSWLAANYISCRLIKNTISYRAGLFLFIQRTPTVALPFNLQDVFQKQSGEIPLQLDNLSFKPQHLTGIQAKLGRKWLPVQMRSVSNLAF